MTIPFVKMHGAGNDFVMIDDRVGNFPCENRNLIATIANRPDGIGCEGVILVQKSDRVDFRMRFFNPDGGEAELCGNGARCVAAFAISIGAVKSSRMVFETMAGDIEAEVLESDRVRIQMPTPKNLRKNFVNSGVPHAIVAVDDLDGVDVKTDGCRIRNSEEFAPAGTNVDFVKYQAPHRVDIRTYERGVEDETFACGTGAVASAVVGVAQYGMEFPVRVVTRRGCVLEIGGEVSNGDFCKITLIGPVKFVFKGEVDC